jgi:pimeloyl-ACP methyl ester carboxylesterase
MDEGAWININGVPQWIAIRGRDAAKPVLLFFHGGPGLGICQSAPVFDAWMEDFTVVLWDQPGGGFTGMRSSEPASALNLDRYVRDGIAVAEYARAKLGKRRMVLMGISWGTRLGLNIVRRRPDLFSAYVGTAQVTGRRGDRLGWERAIEIQRGRGNAANVAKLEALGPPPYKSVDDFLIRQQFTNPPQAPMSAAETAKTGAMNKLMVQRRASTPWIPADTPAPGARTYPMFIETLGATFPDRDFEIRELGNDWRIPMFVFQGDNDLNAPEASAREWFEEIRAPLKRYEVIAGAGHNTTLFHEELHVLLRRHVVRIAKA